MGLEVPPPCGVTVRQVPLNTVKMPRALAVAPETPAPIPFQTGAGAAGTSRRRDDTITLASQAGDHAEIVRLSRSRG